MVRLNHAVESIDYTNPTKGLQFPLPFPSIPQLLCCFVDLLNPVSVRCKSGQTFTARHVILAMAPQLWPRISFTPSLPLAKREIAHKAHFGGSAKILVHYAAPYWRERGYAGTILSDKGPISFSFDDCEVEWEGEDNTDAKTGSNDGDDDAKSKPKSSKSSAKGSTTASTTTAAGDEKRSKHGAASSSSSSSIAKFTLMGFVSANDAWPWLERNKEERQAAVCK